MKEGKSLGSAVSLTLVRLNEWATSVLAGGLDATLNLTSAGVTGSLAPELIETIAESLIQVKGGIERDLLSKSLQETLLYCIGIDTGARYPQLKSKLTRFLNRRGTAALIQQFLSLYFFNFVWFETGESFRAVAATSSAFEEDMDSVERICEKAVASSWKAHEIAQRPLDSLAAQELFQDIAKSLRGM